MDIILLLIILVLVSTRAKEEFNLEAWLKKAAFSGLTVNVNVSEENAGQLTISFGSDTYREEMDKNLRELRDDGKKVEAIKRLRQEAGIGLREAKDYVDAL